MVMIYGILAVFGVVGAQDFLKGNLNRTDSLRWKQSRNCTDDDRMSAQEWPKFTGSLNDEDSAWFENLPIPPVAVATSMTLADGECKNQLQLYLRELRNGTMWATQMYDSSAKYPYGIVDGHTSHLGNFDQCYRIDVKPPIYAEKYPNIRGRYCLVDFHYRETDAPTHFNGKHDYDFDDHGAAWEAIREKGDFRRVKRYMLEMAICVPAACTSKDIETSLRGPYEELEFKYNLRINIHVDPRKCQAYHEEPEFSKGAIIYSVIVGIIVLLVITATMYDSTLHEEEKTMIHSKNMELLLCFSASRNLKTIFEVNYKHRGLDCIHLCRFFATCLCLIGHRTMLYWLNTVVNQRYIELTFNAPAFVIVHNGPIIVDTFLAFGGMLSCYGLLEHFDKTKHANFLMFILIRFVRFTPLYALAIFFYATVFPHFGSGPLWGSKIRLESEYCANHWWKNIFYLNNYVKQDEMCMFQSWYLAVDFQCFIVTIFAVYAFWKLPRKLGYGLLALLTFGSCAITFYITYVHRIQPVFIGYPALGGVLEDPYFVNYYVKSHMRASAYLVGVIAGALLYDCKFTTWRLPKIWSNILFMILVVGLSITAQALAFKYYNPNTNASPLDTALYASLHRGAFAASFCAIILLVEMGNGLDFHYNFLTPGWAQPLGRLAYSVFLTHNFIHLYDMGTTRTAKTFSIFNAFWDLVPDVIYSFSLALLVAICIEGPFRRMEKVLLHRKSHKNLSSTESMSRPEVVKKMD